MQPGQALRRFVVKPPSLQAKGGVGGRDQRRVAACRSRTTLAGLNKIEKAKIDGDGKVAEADMGRSGILRRWATTILRWFILVVALLLET